MKNFCEKKEILPLSRKEENNSKKINLSHIQKAIY